VLSHTTGLDLAAYRPEHVAERVRRALEREGVASEAELVHLFRHDADARSRFRRSVAVSVSGLFRDPKQFELLERDVLPTLLEGRRRVRVWSAGCADGSELYSVAMLLDRLGVLDRSFLFGSDLLDENLEAARRGTYGDVQVPPELRSRVRFERRDLVREPPPPGKWNLVLCRNVAIYLAPAAKHSLYAGLAASLALGGVLLLGRSERLADPKALGLRSLRPHAYARAA
jgi:chemotaxis protein methyltransferase CheR